MSTLFNVILPWVNLFVLAFLFAAGPVLYDRMGQAIAAQKDSAVVRAERVLYEAIGRAGGVAKAAFLATGAPLTNAAALKLAAAAGAAYLQNTIPATLAAKGIDPTAAGTLAAAEMLKQLPGFAPVDMPGASEPNVKAAKDLLATVLGTP